MKKEDKKIKKEKNNRLIYLITVILIIIVYLVIHLFGGLLKDKIYSNDIPKQPVNNIFAIHKEPVKPVDDKPSKPSDDDVYFMYLEDDYKGNIIKMYNQFPIQDEVGKKLEGEYHKHDFKIFMNSKAVGVKYKVTLEKLVNSDLDDDWAKIYLTSNGNDIANCYRDTGRIKTYNEYLKYNNKANEIILYEGVVSESDAQRGYKSFTLRMWISEDVHVVNSTYHSRTINARVNVYAGEGI